MAPTTFSAWRMFGELLNQLLKTNTQPAEEKELNILLDAVILNRPKILLEQHFDLMDTSVLGADNKKKITISSLQDLEEGKTYVTDKGTNLSRNKDEVILGDVFVSQQKKGEVSGKVVIPVPQTDVLANSRPVMKGSLHATTLLLAIEQFTGKKLSDGMIFLEAGMKLAHFINKLDILSQGTKYISQDFYFFIIPRASGMYDFAFTPETDDVAKTHAINTSTSHLNRDFVAQHSTPRRSHRINSRTPSRQSSFQQPNQIASAPRSQFKSRLVEVATPIMSTKRNRSGAATTTVIQGTAQTPKPSQSDLIDTMYMFQNSSPVPTPLTDLLDFTPPSHDKDEQSVDSPSKRRRKNLPSLFDTPLTSAAVSSGSLVKFELPQQDCAPTESTNGAGGPPPLPPPMPTKLNANRKKLRLLRWSSIANHKLSGTIWAKTQDIQVPELKESEIEGLFSVSPVKNKADAENEAAKNISGKQGKSSRINLFGIRRYNNINIILARLKMQPSQLRDSILQLPNSTPIDQEVLEKLITVFPLTDVEKTVIAKLNEAELDPHFDLAELFIIEMEKIPRIETKLRTLGFNQKIEEMVAKANKDLSTLQNAFEEIQGSERFPHILKIILSIGSVLNRDTYLSSKGFKLESLREIGQTKSKVGNTTLLNYLAKIIFEQSADLLNFIDDLASCEKASNISLDDVSSAINMMVENMERVKDEIELCKNDACLLDQTHLIAQLESLYSKYEEIVESIQQKGAALWDLFLQVCQYFGEDAESTLTTTEFFSIITSFALNLQNAHKENQNRAINDEKNKQPTSRFIRRKSKLGSQHEIYTETKSDSTKQDESFVEDNSSLDAEFPVIQEKRVEHNMNENSAPNFIL